jgi:predicted metal-dependent hydrolase
MSAVPADGELVVRRVPFEFPDDLSPVWHPGHHEWSHMVNGASLAMPYLEPFLIATLREATKQIDDPVVSKEAAGFIAQEAQHFRTHRRYNELLKASGYPALADVEAAMERSYDRLRTRSLGFRLAYACGFETMTMGVTSWMVGERTRLFHGSDTRIASFILWHMVEEVEHKRVAFDVYQAADGAYLQRLVGVFTGSAHVFWWSRKACIAMLKTDGRWRDLRSRARLWRRTAEFFVAIAPTVARSASPRHDPRHDPDPPWVRQWIAGYAAADPTAVPLLDTSDPTIPIPFATTGG